VPEWADLVKLGINKELAPIDPDWYFVRAASIARRLYIRSPTGEYFF
jgi:ribosomal protein S19E (S16A)